MNATSYSSPVDKLLTYGDCRNFRDWPNYLDLGFGPEHVNDLIRMATDEALNQSESDGLEVWAPIHAWRALGQLRAESAIAPLVEFFDQVEPDEAWGPSELPEVMGMIGPAAIPALAEFLSNPEHTMYPCTYAGDSLAEIGKQHPAVREECIRSIVVAVENFEKNEPDLNGFLIANLLDLKAVEAAPVIERAFAADCVDPTIAGDWEDVQVEFGLIESRKTERGYSLFDRLFKDEASEDEEGVVDDDTVGEPSTIAQNNRKTRKAEKLKIKNKRAMVKKSRRQNRKKK